MGPGFALSSLIGALGDTEQTHFASRMGAGITDLYMNALDYSWRDNAACLSGKLDPHADFLYSGGSALGHGVVLAEARGSFAATVSDAKMAREAERKYLRQVRPYIGATSPHGTGDPRLFDRIWLAARHLRCCPAIIADPAPPAQAEQVCPVCSILSVVSTRCRRRWRSPPIVSNFILMGRTPCR
jgi:hypothetical protein